MGSKLAVNCDSRGSKLWEGNYMGETNGRKELFSKICYTDPSWCLLH